MKIKDTLYLTDQRMVHVGGQVSSRSIRDKNVKDLIDRLKERGIEINPADSEQDIEYRVLGTEKKATVPLNASFDNSVSVVGYILRTERLEIGLKDYHKSSGTGERIGGAVRLEDGIQCSLLFDGTYEEGKQFETAKNVLRKFYT